jgi:hypothetical protein
LLTKACLGRKAGGYLDRLDLVSEAAERIAENEVVLREVNARIAEKTSDLEARGLADGDETSEYLCSCGRPDCDAYLMLTLTEFEQAHASDDQFVVAPGHENPQIEDVVAGHDGYLVVRKRPGYKPEDVAPDV